jgi:hypothetical protein
MNCSYPGERQGLSSSRGFQLLQAQGVPGRREQDARADPGPGIRQLAEDEKAPEGGEQQAGVVGSGRADATARRPCRSRNGAVASNVEKERKKVTSMLGSAGASRAPSRYQSLPATLAARAMTENSTEERSSQSAPRTLPGSAAKRAPSAGSEGRVTVSGRRLAALGTVEQHLS